MSTTTVITVTHNRAGSLPGAIESVLSQVPPVLEHIIVDGMSVDATPEIVAEYANRAAYYVRHIREPDTGIYDAMNKAVHHAKGTSLYFLNDDDRLASPSSLALARCAMATTQASLVVGDILMPQTDRLRPVRRQHRQLNRLNLAARSVCQQAILYDRKALQQVGRFDDSLRIYADYDWLLRALLVHRLPVVYLRHVLAMFSPTGRSGRESSFPSGKAEVARVRERYFSATDLARARRYRRFWRKIPFGAHLISGPGDRLRLSSRIVVCGRLWPDPLALLGL